MAPPTGPGETTKQRIASLEGELRILRQQAGAIFSETLQATKVFQGIVVAIGLFAGIFTIWSTDRVDSTIQKAEQRIALLVGEHIPKGSRIQSLSGEGLLSYALYIQRSEAYGRKGYKLVAETTSAEIIIEGDQPGRLSGSMVSWKGVFVEKARKEIADYLAAFELERISRPLFIPLVNSPEGVLMAPGVPVALSYRLSMFFEDCEKAKQFSKVSAQRNYSLTTLIKPVLLTSNQPLDSASFRSKLFDMSDKFNCDVKPS